MEDRDVEQDVKFTNGQKAVAAFWGMMELRRALQ
jgi:hypothetical protein